MNTLARDTLRDHGVLPDAAGARRYLRFVQPRREITSVGRYVAVCRAFARGWERMCPDGTWRPLEGEGRVDGRLVAVGWNHESPTQWIREGGLDRFLRYWWSAVPRPEIVGSSHNLVGPEAAYVAMRRGIPPHVLLALGERATISRDTCTDLHRLPRRRIRRLGRMARAAARTSMRDHAHLFGADALAALGRLCPELQRVAIEALKRDPRWPSEQAGIAPDGWGSGSHRALVIRARDLPWETIARVQRQLSADTSGRVRVAWAAGRRRMNLYEGIHGPSFEITPGWLAPAYPRLPLEMAIRVARSETPSQLADGQLSKKEAHAWLTSGPNATTATPLLWLSRRLPAGTPPLRSITVVRWLLDVQRRGSWHALTQERDIAGPGGRIACVRFLDRVDEIQDEDLDRGVRTGVERAFARAAERVGTKWLEGARGDHRVLQSLPRGWRLYRCMRHLCTPAALVREGEELEHCVGGYLPSVEQGQSIILSITVLGHRSTVELSPDGRVLQHHGPRNTTPHVLCQRVLERFLRRI